MIAPKAMNIIVMIIITGIHRGDVTHHQDQEIRPVSLRVKKIRNSTIVVLSPEVVLDDAMFE